MKRYLITTISAAVLAALMLACGGSGTKSTDEVRSPGEMTFRASCQTCHRLPKPASHTDSEWPTLVARYGERAKLSPEQVAQITAYLTAAN